MADCTNLLELNFTADFGNLELELDCLIRLIARNPVLRALSVEKFYIRNMEICQLLLAFVQLLDDYPTVSCLFLDFSLLSNLDKGDSRALIIGHFETRIKRINSDSVVCLDLLNIVRRSHRSSILKTGRKYA